MGAEVRRFWNRVQMDLPMDEEGLSREVMEGLEEKELRKALSKA